MKQTDQKAPPAKNCAGPGCGKTTLFPYAKEAGDTYFCQRSCWEAYRQTQPPFYVVGQVRTA